MGDVGFQRGLPRWALGLDLQGSDGRGRHRPGCRRVLVHAQLLAATERYLIQRGALLTRVTSAEEAVDRLAAEKFDVVVVDADPAQSGLALVKAIKFGHRVLAVADDDLGRARQFARLTPFLVLPPPAGGTEFAVIVHPPHAAYLEDTTSMRVEDVMLRLDAGSLVREVN